LLLRCNLRPNGEPLLSHRGIFHLGLALALFASLAVALPAQNPGTELRTVHGQVLDKNDNPVPSSIVYLLNVKTQAVRTYIADAAGQYRFSGLDPNVDYEVHAEHNGLTSSVRTVSSFDSRRDIEVILKLSHTKPSK
jgi:Carboxypeptidase regulatory-like domain